MSAIEQTFVAGQLGSTDCLGSKRRLRLLCRSQTAYPLTFRLYGDNKDDESKYDLAREVVTELEEEAGVHRYTYLFDPWVAHDSDLIGHLESYYKDWIGPLRSNRQVTDDQEVDDLMQELDHLFVHVQS